jgi:hypothetical protein
VPAFSVTASSASAGAPGDASTIRTMSLGAEVDLAVRNLTGRYCQAVVHFDVELFASCWATDAEWVVPKVKTTTGRDAIVELYQSLRGGFRLCTQELMSGVIEPAGEGSGAAGVATATWQVRELQWPADPERAPVCVIGIYTDTIVREDGRWCFARRQFDALYRGPVDLTGRVFAP